MSRTGLISDVHGNLPALRAVVERLRGAGATRWVCAGDLVGYGAAPDECVEEVCALPGIVAVAGNHDLFALGRLDWQRHGPAVRLSSGWTAERLGAAARSALAGLPLRATAPPGVEVAHGSLEDPEEYVRDRAAARRQLGQLAAEGSPARTLVLGHTHRPLLVAHAGRTVVNPGAVGQSRERRLHARGALLDDDTGSVEHVTVGYDVGAARAAQRRAGLPEEFLHLPPEQLPRLRGVARRVLRRG